MDNTFAELYAPRPDIPFAVKYRATCHCAAVRYEVSADPVDAKMCHCATCQTLHGAPMQWAAIFHKHHVRISQGQRPCPRCGAREPRVFVHGHYQCQSCRSNIDDRCQGEVCETNRAV